MFDGLLDKELRNQDCNLTIAATLYSMVTFTSVVFFFVFINLFDNYWTETMHHTSILADEYICDVIANGLNADMFLIIALSVWCLLNIVQMICLAIDQWRNEHNV